MLLNGDIGQGNIPEGGQAHKKSKVQQFFLASSSMV